MNLLFHIRVYTLCLIAVLCCSTAFAQTHRNPFLEMVGKKYGDYYYRYEFICDSLFAGDAQSRAELLRLFSEAAAADPTGAWELDHDRMEKHVRFYNSRKGGFTPSADYTAEKFTDDLLEIADRAQKKGLEYVGLVALYNAGDAFRIFSQDYERAFKCYLEVAVELEKLTQREFPLKLFIYCEIANFYSSFGEFEDAAVFWRKIINDPDANYKNNHRLYPALNGLGGYFRHEKKYDQSDSCYIRILELASNSVEDTNVWGGIAGGNLGFNYYLRGDMNKALEWMESALQKMKRPEDDSYTCHLAADIADIYLKKGDKRNGKKYLDLALFYHKRSLVPRKNSHLLEVMTRYHAITVGQPIVNTYLDSTLQAKKREDEAFSGLVLRRVEQRLRAADQKVHEQELGAEKIRSKMYRQTAILIAVALVIMLLLLFLLAFYYRRTRRAYRELVRKSQEWAGIESPDEPEIIEDAIEDEAEDEVKTEDIPEESDRLIMENIEKVILKDGFYKQSDLTLDMLVTRLGLNRSYISSALNRCTGKNFNTFINEFRVKEAIRLMSEPLNNNLTIEAIGFEAGFNDRSSFYRIFKKITALSPTEFRRNIYRKGNKHSDESSA